MAKKPRNPIDAEDDEQLKLEFIPAPKLASLMRAIRKATKAKDEAVGELRGHIAQAVEKNFLRKKAFAYYRKFEDMGDELHDEWNHFIHMMTVSGTLKRAQTKLVEEAEDEILPPKGRDESNLVHIGRGRRKVSDEVA